MTPVSSAHTPDAAVPADIRQGVIAYAVAWVRSVIALTLVSVYILVLGPPAFLIARRWSDILFILTHPAVAVALRVVGIGRRVEGREHIPAGRAAVYCANHESNLDPPILFPVLNRRIRMLYKAEMDRIPILGALMPLAGYVGVARGDRDKAAAALEQAADAIRAGRSFLIFPEGTRSRTGELLPFKKGGFIMALDAGAPIVPVAVIGAGEAMRKGSVVIRPVTVSIRIGEPVETAGLTLADRDRVIAEVRSRIEQLRALGPIAW